MLNCLPNRFIRSSQDSAAINSSILMNSCFSLQVSLKKHRSDKDCKYMKLEY